jgi:Ankyrin repeat
MAPYELHPLAALLQVHSVHHTIRHYPRFGPHAGYGFFTQDQLPIFWVICAPSFKIEWMLPRLHILLEHGAEVNVYFHNTCRPDHDDEESARHEESARLTIARFLVDSGADPNLLYPPNSPYPPLPSNHCQTLCDCIALYFSADVILFLLEIGSNPNQCNQNGVTALTLAVREGHDNSVYKLIHYGGANPLMQTYTIETCFQPGCLYYDVSPIELACAMGSLCVLELLLDKIPTHQRNAHSLQRSLYIECAFGPLRSVEHCLNYIPTEQRSITLLQGALYMASKSEQVNAIHFLVMHIINVTMLYSVKV